ncbi:hypothetical protein MFIFM68171_08269 [Madurella fahalii]|uniref:Uncharacterized protein n=1 Tax=Madurella fahalii TaxID=1157608 RepID=A0ABQ0GK38_9PEZI
MRFTVTAAVFALLTAGQITSAWQLITYQASEGCGSEAPNRVLSGGSSQTDCYTIGQAMPGVSCAHYDETGAPDEPCSGPLRANSVRVGLGESCELFDSPSCEGVRSLVHRINACVSIGSEIRSFRCGGSIGSDDDASGGTSSSTSTTTSAAAGGPTPSNEPADGTGDGSSSATQVGQGGSTELSGPLNGEANDSSISAGAIAGIVVGGIAALVLGLAVVLWLHRRSLRNVLSAPGPIGPPVAEPIPQETYWKQSHTVPLELNGNPRETAELEVPADHYGTTGHGHR